MVCYLTFCQGPIYCPTWLLIIVVQSSASLSTSAMPESSIPSRGSRGTRGGRGSARGRGGKAHAPGKIFWHVSDDAVEPDPANTPPKRKANYVNNTYSLTTSGAFSSRLTYVNADASPKRHRSIANSEWIHTPPTPSDISDEYPWMDPAYDDFMLQVSVNPPKRKRTAGVSGPLPYWTHILTPSFRIIRLRCFYPIVPSFWQNFCGWKEGLVASITRAHVAMSRNHLFDA